MTVYALDPVVLTPIALPPDLERYRVTVPNGTRYHANSRGYFGRVKNDLMVYGMSRTALPTWNFPNRTTNMIQDAQQIYWKDGKMRASGKPSVDVRHSPWWPVLRYQMGDVVLERFTRDGYGVIGFMDNGPDLLHCLFCGGDVVRELDVMQNREGKISILEVQKYSNGPGYTDPKSRPHLWIKQNNVSTSPKRAYNELVDKGEQGGNGDVWFPALAENDAEISEMYPNISVVGLQTEKIAFFPRPPFECQLHGVDVTIEELCLWGSNVYGRVGIYWYVLDEMRVRGVPSLPGYAGDMDDRVVNVGMVYSEGKTWEQLLPPGVPEIGWIYRHKPPDYEW